MPTVKKKSLGDESTNLWNQELVEPASLEEYSEEIADTEKKIIFGESNSGKTQFYLGKIQYLKKKGVKPEDFMMCIIFSDRPTGITKLLKTVPEEFRSRIFIFPINTYEEMVSATALGEKKLMEHFAKKKKHGTLVSELLEESWKMSQDYYSRKAYGENLGDYFATKIEVIKEMMKDKGKAGKDSAYQAFTGFTDWTTIKYFHNFNWIDKIKRMPFNVIFTAEVKAEENKDSIFYQLGYRPAGEKDNMHRVDEIIHLTHQGNKFTIQPFKLTGFTRLYNKTDVTGKNAYEVHEKSKEKLEELGFRSTVFEELEQEAGVIPPKEPKKTSQKLPPKSEKQKEEEEETGEEEDAFFLE